MLSVWPPLSPSTLLRTPARPRPFPLGEAGCRLYARGRHGLWQGLRVLGVSHGDEILVPAYHHGSEVEAVHRSGATCRFYAGTDELEPDEEELEALITPSTRALHIIHYLGFSQDARRWHAWCRERGLLLVEDAAPAWLSLRDGLPVGSLGDLAIFSIYKTVGVPEGGAVVCKAAVPGPRARSSLGLGGLVRRHGAWLAQRIGERGVVARRGHSRFDPALEFGLGEGDASASVATRFLLPRFQRGEIAAARRRNYRGLLEALSDRVPQPFDELPEGVCPWVFPVQANDKQGLLRHLLERGIVGLNLWSVPHPTLPVDRFPDAAFRRARAVALPVHQELRERDRELVAKHTLAWYGRGG